MGLAPRGCSGIQSLRQIIGETPQMARRGKTALKKFERLESLALWRDGPDAQRREVMLSFGLSSIIITDTAERPLGHWSLTAIERLNPGGTPALFAPDSEASETLEIDDPTMIEAIETVRRAIARKKPRNGRLRLAIGGLTFIAVSCAGIFGVPAALEKQALKSLPSVAEQEIGAAIATELWKITGRPCRSTFANGALDALRNAVVENSENSAIYIVKDAIKTVVGLPGGSFAIGAPLVEDFDSPAISAGYLASAVVASSDWSPMNELVDSLKFFELVNLVTTGKIDQETASRFARKLISEQHEIAPDEDFIALLVDKGISIRAIADAIDITGEFSIEMNEAAIVLQPNPSKIMNDGDWVALQAICEN